MEREKTLALLLLELSAFAFIQNGEEESKADFEAACRLADEYKVDEVEGYRDFVSRIEQDGPYLM